MSFPVFDLHCDTALALLGENYDSCGNLRRNPYHIDLDRVSILPGYAQCFACYTTTGDYPDGLSPLQIFERELATILSQIEANADRIALAYSGSQIEANRRKGIFSGVLTIEGPAGIDFNPELLEDLYKIGFRITTLGWNEKNSLTGSHITGGGLTELGREYVREAQRVGMLVDVSHISDEGFWDIMEITNRPIIASHSNSRAVWDVSRNLTDDMFRAICQTGGVAGINLYSDFLGADPDLTTVCDHILHFLSLDPAGTHIALGGDLDGCDRLPAGFSGVQDYPKLAESLLNAGLTDEQVMNIFWNNAIGVIEHAVH